MDRFVDVGVKFNYANLGSEFWVHDYSRLAPKFISILVLNRATSFTMITCLLKNIGVVLTIYSLIFLKSTHIDTSILSASINYHFLLLWFYKLRNEKYEIKYRHVISFPVNKNQIPLALDRPLTQGVIRDRGSDWGVGCTSMESRWSHAREQRSCWIRHWAKWSLRGCGSLQSWGFRHVSGEVPGMFRETKKSNTRSFSVVFVLYRFVKKITVSLCWYPFLSCHHG